LGKSDLGTTFKGDTIIGNDVCIGFEAIVMSGVRIGARWRVGPRQALEIMMEG